MPQFKIHTIQKNVITGILSETGKVLASDFIFLATTYGEKRFRIRDISIDDQNITLEFSENINIEINQLTSTHVRILTPIRGADISLLVSYGNGRKWWTILLVNLALMGLLALMLYIFHLIKII